MEHNSELANEKLEITEELSNQSIDPEKDDSISNKDDSIKKMKDSLGEMMKLNSPVLDIVESIASLPLRILTNGVVLQAAIYTLLPALAWREALILVGIATESYFATLGVDLVKQWSKNADEAGIKSKLVDFFQKEGLIIHSFNRGGDIPMSLLSLPNPAEGFHWARSGDLIRLSYRGYHIICCNIALVRTPVEGFVDSYTQDDEQARNYFHIQDGLSVIYYGSVFMFLPGPEIKGNVRLAEPSPIEYLKVLQKLKLGNFMTEPELSDRRLDLFRRYHLMEGDNSGNELEIAQVFTQRVKDMIMQLEWEMKAPVTVYADHNITCLTIQDRVYDFECIHDRSDTDDEVASVLYGKIASFRNILDEIIGPEGSEYTELLGTPGEHRKSSYTPFFAPINTPENPEDDDVRTYVSDLTRWGTGIYRVALHHDKAYLKAFDNLDSVSTKFLTLFLAQVDLEQAKKWLESITGNKLKDSLTKVVIDHVRYIWNAVGKCEVRNIRRERVLKNIDTPPSKITFDIVVNPPIRKWEYLSETNRRLVEMCDPSLYSLKQLNSPDYQKALVYAFEKNLKALTDLTYDVDHIYPAAITMNEGEKYGMKDEEIIKFINWYVELTASDMEINGATFVIEGIDRSKKKK